MMLVAFGCFLMSHVSADSHWTVLLPGFLAAGVGVGITNPVLASATVSVVPPERSGMASGSSSTFRQVGIATGIAGLGAIFLSQVKGATTDALSTSAAGRLVLAHGGKRVSEAVAGGGVREAAASIPVPAARHALLDAYAAGYTSTFNHLMAISTVVAFVGAVGALVLVRQRDFVPSYAAPDPGVARPEVDQAAASLGAPG